MNDWKTLKNTDRTERPSRDLRLFQNCTSREEEEEGGERINGHAVC